jgi:hypothetical protein
MTRAYSTTNCNEQPKIERPVARRDTFHLENARILGGRGKLDSFAALIFPETDKHSSNVKALESVPTSVIAKKRVKNDSQKIEELQISYEALKVYLQAALDDNERLIDENQKLREEKLETSTIDENSNNDEQTESELEATL